MKWLLLVMFSGLLLVASALLLLVAWTWPPQLGLDLRGGIVLVYEIDRGSLPADGGTPIASEQLHWGALIQALAKRINPAGTKEVTVRRSGDWRVEIIVPEVEPTEIERIKKLISTAGALEFRIVANEREHYYIIATARERAEDPLTRRSRFVVGDDHQRIGYWARVGRDAKPEWVRPFKVSPLGHVVRNAATGEILDLTRILRVEEQYAVERYLDSQGITDIEILMATDDGFDVTGAHLGLVSRGFDETMQPSVNFAMRGEGIDLMGGLTGSVVPRGQPPFYQLLGIMLDGELLSAPRVMSTISDRGRITGRFTQQEVDFLVAILQAGSLPHALQRLPVTEEAFAASEATWQAVRLIVVSTLGLLAVTWLLMLLRYRLTGLAASLSSLLQLLLMLAMVELIHAPVTMPAVVAAAAMALCAAASNIVICEFVRRRRDTEGARRPLVPGLVLTAAAVGVPLVILTVLASIVYTVLDSPARQIAVAVVVGSFTAVPTSCLCLPLLAGLIAVGRRARGEAEADVVAEIVN